MTTKRSLQRLYLNHNVEYGSDAWQNHIGFEMCWVQMEIDIIFDQAER